MAVVGAAVVLRVARGPEHRLALDSLPEEVTAHRIQGVPVFLVRDGTEVEGYLDDAQHLPNEQLWWCPDEKVFVSPFHGELFDAQGRVLAGPAFRDLDRVSVKILAGVVVVDPFIVQQGTARRIRDFSPLDSELWSAYRAWSGLTIGGPSSFCQPRIVG